MNLPRFAPCLLALAAAVSTLSTLSSSALATPLQQASLNVGIDRSRTWGGSVPVTSPLAGTFSLRVIEGFAASRRPGVNRSAVFSGKVGSAKAARRATDRAMWVTLGEMPFYSWTSFQADSSYAIVGLDARTSDLTGQMLVGSRDAYGETAPDKVTRGFPTGHIAVNATGAALSCVHHTRIPLYTKNRAAADAFACGAAIGATGLTAVARVVADKHYVSDVSAGIGIGVVAGWLFPKVLHYTSGNADAKPAAAKAPIRLPDLSFMVLPSMSLSKTGNIETVGATARGIF